MSSDNLPDYWSPADDDSLEVLPATEAKGELTPPPRKPPTAINADAAQPEPQRWEIPTRRSDLPRGVAEAIDAALDVLDSIGDTIRSTATRLAG